MKRLCAYIICLILAATAAQAQPAPGQGALLHYVSEIDGSTQPYGLYLPSNYDPLRPQAFPLVVHLGGYGYEASSYFPSSLLNSYGSLMLNYEGRSRLQYDGVAEWELLQLLGELKSTYNIDPNRIYMEGHSMGSTGSMRIGIRHPHVFAAVAGGAGFLDYNEWYERWYAPGPPPDWGEWRTEFSGPGYRKALLEQSSVVHLAENARHLPAYFTAGTLDTTNRPFGARNLHARLTELGYNHTYLEFYTGHGAGWSLSNALNYFFSNGFANNPHVPDIMYKTNQLKYNSAYWVQIDRLERHLEWATIDTNMDAASNRIDVNVSNIHQYTLKLTEDLLLANGFDLSSPVVVYTNGMLSYSGAAGEITLYAVLCPNGNITGWPTTSNLPGGLVKSNKHEGPISHAFMSPFTLLYGDGYQHEADIFAADWNDSVYMKGSVTPYHHNAITLGMIQNSNLILFGTTETNSIISHITFNQALPFNVPIIVTDQTITVGENVYDTANYGIFFIYPNPLNPDRYVVVSQGTFLDHNLGWEQQAMPWGWPDYVVFEKDFIYDYDTMTNVQGYFFSPSIFVETGFFTNYWNLTEDDDPTRQPWWPIAGDANHDCTVNILDLIFVRNRLGQGISDSADNWQADLNNDGQIDINDLMIVRLHMNNKCDPQQ